jgi:hypothetical protein
MTGLDTDSFLMAFTRFVHLHGRPEMLVSDNGSNFRAANVIFQQLLDLDEPQLSGKYPQIKWHFAPAHAPFYMGVVERMVAKAKRALEAILNGINFNEEQLATAATIATSIINNIPLTYQLSDADEPQALTPNHFLHGHVIRSLVPDAGDDLNLIKKWQELQRAMDRFWERFSSEVLPTLNKFHAIRPEYDIKVGDVVIMIDNHAKGQFFLARVVESTPGPDGRVRKLHLRHKNAIFIRHPNSVCRLVADTPQHVDKNSSSEVDWVDHHDRVDHQPDEKEADAADIHEVQC